MPRLRVDFAPAAGLPARTVTARHTTRAARHDSSSLVLPGHASKLAAQVDATIARSVVAELAVAARVATEALHCQGRPVLEFALGIEHLHCIEVTELRVDGACLGRARRMVTLKLGRGLVRVAPWLHILSFNALRERRCGSWRLVGLYLAPAVCEG